MPAAIIGGAGVALNAAEFGYNVANNSDAAQPISITGLTPAQEKFFALQSLQAEKDAEAQTAAISNAADQQTTASSLVKFVAATLGGWLIYKIVKHRHWI